MQPFVNLFQFERIRLCAPRPEDSNAIALWSEDSAYLRQMDTDFARPYTAANALPPGMTERSPQNVYFHIRTLADDTLVGFVTLHSLEWNNGTALLAIGIGGAENRGQGYGTEALALILNYAFYELNLHRVGLNVIGDNERAIRAYQKVGFQKEGVTREAVQRDGQRQDLIWMGVLRSEWLSRPALAG